jgi:ERCC4-type nuclease
MNEFSSSLRKNAMFLLKISENEIIQTAGIVQKVKNFFSKLVNPEHRKKVLELENDTATAQEVIEKLNQALNGLQEAIASGNLEEYKIQAKIVQELSLALLRELKIVNQEAQEVKKILKTTYTLEEMEKDEFLSNFKSSLPEGYDLELNTILRQPLKNFSWFKDLSPSDIGINVGENAALSI